MDTIVAFITPAVQGDIAGRLQTTLVNHVLSQCTDAYIGIIVDEFGGGGIDGALIVPDEQPLIEITNSCICCTVRKDLTTAAQGLLARWTSG